MSEEKPTPTQPQRTEVKTEPASTVQVLPVIVFVLSEDQYRQALAPDRDWETAVSLYL